MYPVMYPNFSVFVHMNLFVLCCIIGVR